MSRGLALFNALGVAILAVVACLQWWSNRAQHEQFLEEHRVREASETELAEVRKRATSLDGDVERLKAGLTDAQKVADEGSTARQQAETQLKTLTMERDQLRQHLAKWEAAVRDRDARVEELSKQLKESRERLDEAIKRIEGKKP